MGTVGRGTCCTEWPCAARRPSGTQRRLGGLCASGADIPQDLATARDYLETAAPKSTMYEQFARGNLNIDKEPQRAETLPQKGAAAGN